MPKNMMSKEEMTRRYKPRRPEMTLDDVTTAESRAKQQAMVQEAKDEAAQKAATKAFDTEMPTPEKYSKGGSASSRADGIAVRGKTRGTMVMCGGGMARGKK